MKIDAGFIIVKSVMGPYWQVRVRDLRTGSEDTVDRCYSLETARAKWDRMTQTMTALRERP